MNIRRVIKISLILIVAILIVDIVHLMVCHRRVQKLVPLAQQYVEKMDAVLHTSIEFGNVQVLLDRGYGTVAVAIQGTVPQNRLAMLRQAAVSNCTGRTTFEMIDYTVSNGGLRKIQNMILARFRIAVYFFVKESDKVESVNNQSLN